MGLTSLFLAFILGCAVNKPNIHPANIYHIPKSSGAILLDAKINNEGPYLFQLDPGLHMSFLHPDIANELGLQLVKNRYWHNTKAFLHIGKTTVAQRHFLVKRNLFPNRIGAEPLAGLIGQNILKDYIVELDYGKQQIKLHTHREFQMPENSERMGFSRENLNTNIAVHYEKGGVKRSRNVRVQLNPRYQHLSIHQNQLPQNSTITKFSFSGTEITVPKERQIQASYLSTLGYGMLQGHKLLIDFRNKKIALVASEDKVPPLNRTEIKTAHLKKNLKSPKDFIQLAELQIYAKDFPGAYKTVKKAVRKDKKNLHAYAMLVRLSKILHDRKNFKSLLKRYSVEQLIKIGVWVEIINRLWLDGEQVKAKELAQKGIDEAPKYAASWIAYSDISRFEDKNARSQRLLHKAVKASGNPDSFLLRRAWTAYKEKDEYAALTHLRRAIQLNPSGGQQLWFYSRLFANSKHRDILAKDMHEMISDRPIPSGSLDFQAAALHQLGQKEAAKRLFNAGIQRDCMALKEEHAKNNCKQWFNAMIRNDLQNATLAMGELTRRFPNRSDYVDTHALLLHLTGKKRESYQMSLQAAKLDSSDVYMLWQLDLHKE